jgi:hypothetical protein
MYLFSMTLVLLDVFASDYEEKCRWPMEKKKNDDDDDDDPVVAR